jgi:hypothetical protein
MINVDQYLYRTRKSIRQVCTENGIAFDDAQVIAVDSCTSCNIWQKPRDLRLDLDENLICRQCYDHFGL